MRDHNTLLHPLVCAIVEERRAQKLSQAQLAGLAGLSRRALGQIESGGDCTLSTLTRLHAALGIVTSARRQQRPTLDDLVAENAIAYSRSGPIGNSGNSGERG